MSAKQGASLIVYTMLALGAIGYAIEYPHLIEEYKKNPPSWSKYAKTKAEH
ncbi:hypothetical protein PTSG_11651 [Salpingoeca rosetta]|uniref:Uncharacterized protein n=1 Tax=Salpingoeca rosetta (strain ATCC 50818 / BSB-021) TaxID=946362 RepID=F2TXP0_SALR5|nr:uncharacterized protein PTSG_11651 [Salpingoeca rosetta]EGD76149.1 hypothetical protein PTSG_11651 [Salpingoeca rosetta]|eukprot:XP_004998324.1 hypothetical protein PTSG_11651 [Salpingoeca rosetta]